MNIEFRRLTVHQLYGRSFNALTVEGLQPGLNLVLAANGTGKSVLTAAAGRALDCRSLQPGDCLSGHLQIDGAPHDFHLFGTPTAAVDWPQALRPDLYTWTLPDFLRQIASGDCQQLAAALAGGLNLEAFKRDSSPRRPPTALPEAWEQLRQRREQASLTAEQELLLPQRRQELRQSRQAREALLTLEIWRQQRRDQQDLQQTEAALASLQKSWPGLEREESGTRERIGDALAMQEQDRQEQAQARAAMQRFHERSAPRPLQQEDEDALRRLESDWTVRQTAWQDNLHARREAERRHQEQADFFHREFGAPPPEPLPGNIGALAARRLWRDYDVCIRQLQDECIRLQADNDEAENRRLQAAAALPGIAVSAADCRGIFLEQRRLPQLMDALREKRSRQAALGAELGRCQEELRRLANTEHETRSGAALLGQWLALPEAPAAMPMPCCAWSVLVWLPLTAITLLLPVAHALRPAMLCILAGLALALAAMGLAQASQAAKARKRRQLLQAQVPEAWRPAAWSADAVRTTLERALAELAAGQTQHDAVTRLQAMLEGLEPIPEAAELDQLRRQLTERTGLCWQDRDGYDLADLCASLERLAEAEQRCGDVASRLGQAAERLRQTRLDLQESLRNHGIPAEITNGEMAEAWISRIAALSTAQTARAVAAAEAETLGGILLQLQKSLDQIYGRYDFESGDDGFARLSTFRQWHQASALLRQADERFRNRELHLAALLDACGIPATTADASPLTLNERLDELRRRQEPQQEWQNLHRHGLHLHEKLRQVETTDFSQLEPYVALDASPSDHALEELRHNLLEQSGREEALREEISRLEAEIGQASRLGTLAELDRKLHEGIRQTGQWLQNRADAAAARIVCTFLQKKIRDEATPAIVRAANQALDRLTAGRYGDIQVESDAAGPTLSLLDQFDSRRKKFVELSAGTRVHLGIAVRLACMEAAEAQGGVSFPLLLDEVLAVSDLDTSRLIAAALLDLARQRQIILLTCQAEDIFLLQELAGRPLTVIRLHASPMPFTPPSPRPRLNLSLQKIVCPNGALPLRTAISLWPPPLLELLLPEIPLDAETAGAALTRMLEPARSRLEPVLAAVEAARQRLAPALLAPEDIPAGCNWCPDAFREKVLEALADAGGDPFSFLERLGRISRFGRRLDACREWLESGNRLNPPPTQLLLWQTAYDALPEYIPARPLLARQISEFFLPGCAPELPTPTWGG